MQILNRALGLRYLKQNFIRIPVSLPFMHRFVAFLRGINVGGHIVVKEKLKEAFTSLGFQNVSTYKQSGNVVFETDAMQTPKKSS